MDKTMKYFYYNKNILLNLHNLENFDNIFCFILKPVSKVRFIDRPL